MMRKTFQKTLELGKNIIFGGRRRGVSQISEKINSVAQIPPP